MTSILPLPVRIRFFNPVPALGTQEHPLLPNEPEPPDLISLEQRQLLQPPDPPDPPDPPLVNSTTIPVTAASYTTSVITASLLSASGINGPAVSLSSSVIPKSDGRHLRSVSFPSSLTAATKLLRSGDADISSGLFSVWAWPMNQDEVFIPYPHLLTNTSRHSINGRSHIFILNEVHDWLLRFSLIAIRWSCHGNVEAQRIGLTGTFAPSSYLIVPRKSVSRRMKSSPSRRRLPHYVVDPKRVTKEVIVLILVDLVQILAIKSLSHLFLWVHIAQLESFSHSASEPPFMSSSAKLSQLGLRVLESFISSSFVAMAIVIRSVLCMALTLEFSTLKFLSDNSTLSRAISGNIQSKEIIGIVKDIRSISSGFAASSFFHVSRLDNLVVPLCNEHHDLGHRFGLTSSS